MDSITETVGATHNRINTTEAVEKTAALAERYWCSPHELMSYLTRSGQLESAITQQKPVKHVLLFFHALGIGGGELVTCSLAKLWNSMGLDVTILTDVPIDESAPHQKLPEGVRHRVIPDYNTLTGMTYRQRAEELQRVIIETHADAMVFAHWFAESLPYDLILCRENGLVTFIFVQSLFSLFFLDEVKPFLMEIPQTYRLANGVISLSETDRSAWSSFNTHSYVTCNPLSLPIPEHPATLIGHTILWPARLHPDKCPERVIPIMSELVKLIPDAKLIMVGTVSETYRKQFGKLTESAGVTEHIEIVGEVPPNEMQRFYNEADAFLLTSRREGWSLALAEALASGLPCVAYSLPYLTLIKDNEAVIAVDQGDASTAAQALANILTDKALASEMGKAGRAFIQGFASYDHQAFWNSIFGISADPEQNRTLNDIEPFRIAIREAFSAHEQLCKMQHREKTAKDNELVRLSSELDRLSHDCSDLQNALERTTNSLSFKIGRAITGVPRAVRDLLAR